MKKKSIIFFGVTLAMLTLTSCKSKEVIITTEQNVIYSLKDNETYKLEKCNAKSDIYSVAEVFGEKNVTEIGEKAFLNNTHIQDITVPKTITYIADQAFLGCANLTHLHLEDNLIFGKNVFEGCNKIKYNEFKNLNYLSSGENKYYYLVSLKNNSDTFSLNPNTKCILDTFSDSNIKSIELNDGLEIISCYAFYNSKLESVTLPNTLKYISKKSFSNTNIKNITCPDSLLKIGSGAFAGSKLEEITLNESLKEIEPYAFYACDSLTKINLKKEYKCKAVSILDNHVVEEFTLTNENALSKINELYEYDLFLE